MLVETVGGYEPMTEPPTGVEIHPEAARRSGPTGAATTASGYDDPTLRPQGQPRKLAQGGPRRA